jgi:hypothetical protein
VVGIGAIAEDEEEGDEKGKMSYCLKNGVFWVLTRATRRNISEDAILHSHRRENLKSYRDIV